MTKYKRHPIVLNNTTVALIQILSSTDHFEDMWIHDLPEKMLTDYNGYKGAAKQFIEQLDGHYCIAFLLALKKEIEQTIITHDKVYGTKFAEE